MKDSLNKWATWVPIALSNFSAWLEWEQQGGMEYVFNCQMIGLGWSKEYVLVQVLTLRMATVTALTWWRPYSKQFRTKTGCWKTCTLTWGNLSTSTHNHAMFSSNEVSSYSSLCVCVSLVCFFCSTILVCKRRIVDLFPKLEMAVGNIKTAEAAVMQMQMKRQKEFWYLLKIACVSI